MVTEGLLTSSEVTAFVQIKRSKSFLPDGGAKITTYRKAAYAAACSKDLGSRPPDAMPTRAATSHTSTTLYSCILRLVRGSGNDPQNWKRCCFQLVFPLQPVDQDALLWTRSFFSNNVICFFFFSFVAMEKWTAIFVPFCALNPDGTEGVYCFQHLRS